MSPSRIATTQCKLLLSLFAVFGEDVTGLGLTNLGFWTTVSIACLRHAIDADRF